MSRSVVSRFSDPEAMEAAHLAARTQIIPLTREPLIVRSTRVELDQLWLTRTSESAPRLKHVALNPARAFVTFLTEPGPDVIIRGVPMPPASLMRHSRDHSYYERTTGAAHWGTVSLPVDAMIAAGRDVGGCDLLPPPDALVVKPRADRLARFIELHARIARLAETAPEVIANPGSSVALGHALIEAFVKCLAQAEVDERRWAQQCHATIMRRFERILEDHPERPIYVPEICGAIGVPERTLRLCCQEHLGMGPKQYLTVRRMHLAQRELLTASPGAKSVTEIAMHFGFWHFGRFAAEYRALFGEAPSATLRRPKQ